MFSDIKYRQNIALLWEVWRVFWQWFAYIEYHWTYSFGSSRLCEMGQLGIFVNFLYFSKDSEWYITAVHLWYHRGFLEHWNCQKSVSNIWQRFSCLLDEGISKIWKKLNSHGGFLRVDQGSKNVLPDGLNWLCYFAGSSKSHR